MTPRQNFDKKGRGLSEQCDHSRCYWCGRDLVYIALILSREKQNALSRGMMNCGDCNRRGLPDWRPGQQSYNRARGQRRARLVREGRMPELRRGLIHA